MMMNNWFYDKLTKIYEESGKYIHKSNINPCKSCLKCCSVEARLGVRLIEYDYIERFLKEKNPGYKVGSFKDYINKKRKKDYSFIHNICPYYDLKKKRCDIYPARTMSCRLFPYYTTKNDVFFEGCPLNEKAQFLTPENIMEQLPFLKKYHMIANLYDSHVLSQYKLY